MIEMGSNGMHLSGEQEEWFPEDISNQIFLIILNN